MGKRWFVLIVIAIVGILVTTAYAADKMIIVLDVRSGVMEKCFGTNVVGNPAKGSLNLTGVADCEVLTPAELSGKNMKVKHNNALKDAIIDSVPNYTVIRTRYNPNCITIYWNGVPHTVCQ